MAAEKKCTGDCLGCPMQQQIYCSSQRTHAILENQRSFEARLERIERSLDRLASTESLIPLDNAQSAGGAEQ